MRTEFLCVSVLRVASRPRVKLASCEGALTTPTPRGGLLYWPFWGGGPGVGLALYCFVVYFTRWFVLCFALCHFVLFLCFSVLLALRLPRFVVGVGGGGGGGRGEGGGAVRGAGAFREFVRFVLVWFCRFPLLLGVWRATVCDCGTPWTFLFPFLFFYWYQIIFLGWNVAK